MEKASLQSQVVDVSSKTCLDSLQTQKPLCSQISKVCVFLSVGFSITTALICALSTVPMPVSLIASAVLAMSFAAVSLALALFVKCFRRDQDEKQVDVSVISGSEKTEASFEIKEGIVGKIEDLSRFRNE